jgi:hypothetical protein
MTSIPHRINVPGHARDPGYPARATAAFAERPGETSGTQETFGGNEGTFAKRQGLTEHSPGVRRCPVDARDPSRRQDQQCRSLMR